MMEEPPGKRNQVVSLTDEILIEILRRLPVRSICRFKCVSRSWRKLISDPVHRKKLPHTLVGFFYESYNFERYPRKAHHFTNVSGKGFPFVDPSFSFLPVPREDVVLLDSCNGLLLCRCFVPGPSDGDGTRPFHYAVCNPATEKWVMLPDGSCASGEARTAGAGLGFDPAVSSHFHVVEYVVDEADYLTGVEIYSSRTASWSYKESEWGDHVMLNPMPNDRSAVFLNGFMHVHAYPFGIIAVDMEGETWITIPVPETADDDCYIQQAQGHLCLINIDGADPSKLSIWILEDYDTLEWTLKHSVKRLHLFRQKRIPFLMDFKVITVHPECNLIYFVYGQFNTLMAYEMDRKEVRVIRNLGRDCCWLTGTFLPYVPLFSEALGDEQ